MLKEWTSFFLIFIRFFLCIKASHFPLFITFNEKKNDSQTISVIYFHRKKNGVRTAPFFYVIFQIRTMGNEDCLPETELFQDGNLMKM